MKTSLIELLNNTNDDVSNIPHICHRHHRRCLCKNFLLGVNFSRFSEKKCIYLTFSETFLVFLVTLVVFLGVKFGFRKSCLCKRNDKYEVSVCVAQDHRVFHFISLFLFLFTFLFVFVFVLQKFSYPGSGFTVPGDYLKKFRNKISCFNHSKCLMCLSLYCF